MPSREGGSTKGVGAMPRKALVKEISGKGMCVIESEYRTSKCCPCCGCASLKDWRREGNDRVRRCKNGLNGCPLASRGLDRDEIGSMNIAICGVACLLGRERPKHLERKKSSGT